MRMNTNIGSADEYIAGFPEDVQPILRKLRSIIQKAAPKATESISYGMPVYVQGKNLVYFGGFKNHVSFFPTPSGITAFAKELSAYTVSKGTIQFPLNKPLPSKLIADIVKFRVKEVEAMLEEKKKTSGTKAKKK